MSSAINKQLWKGGRFSSSYYAYAASRIRKILALLPEKGKLLDVGCGDGAIAVLAKQKGLEAYGIDISADNVALAKLNGIPAKTCDLNSGKIPFPENTFDAVYCGEVLEHTDSPEKVIREIRRILKRNALLVVTVPNIAAWYNRILLLAGFVPHWVEAGSEKAYGTPFGVISGHTKAFTKNAISELISKNGFSIKSVQGAAINPEPHARNAKEKFGSKLLYIADRAFSIYAPLSSNIIIEARKK